jgi:CubicO group peptidase (beta-lactamase class C family)
MFQRLILTGGLLLSMAVAPARAELPTDLLQEARRRVNFGLNPGLALVQVKAGKTPEIATMGRLALSATSAPVTADTPFEIGSLTKVLTALEAALLEEQQRLSVRTPLAQLWPKDWQPISPKLSALTLSHLLSHTSGLPRMPENFEPQQPADPWQDYTPERLQAFLTAWQGGPQTYAYSNLGYTLVSGLLVAASDAENLSTLMTRDLFQPLGMNTTGFSDPPGPWPVPHADGIETHHWHFSEITAGVGGVRTSARDLARFLQAQLQPPPGLLGQAIRRSHQPLAAGSQPVAYGWHCAKLNGQMLYWHNGETGGFISFMGFVPATGLAAAVLSNNTEAIEDLGLKLLNPESALTAREDPRRTPAQLRPYTGRYRLSPNEEVHIHQDHGYLIVQITGQPALRIYPQPEPHTFAWHVVEARVVFEWHQQQVTGLKIYQNGAVYPAARLSP